MGSIALSGHSPAGPTGRPVRPWTRAGAAPWTLSATAALALMLGPAAAIAQPTPTARDRQAAAEASGQGSAAYLPGASPAARRWFDLAATARAPLRPPPDPYGEADATTGEPPVPGEGSSARVVPAPVTLVAAGLTLLSGGLLLWSAVDAASGVDAHGAMPTPEALRANQAKEERTTWLIATTAILAVTTVVLAILTDGASLRGGSAPPGRAGLPVSVAPVAGPDGGLLALGGPLP
ncbi:MAG: hypothetical protein ACFCGT_25165 [Sandaracinaceae bacterium]